MDKGDDPLPLMHVMRRYIGCCENNSGAAPSCDRSSSVALALTLCLRSTSHKQIGGVLL